VSTNLGRRRTLVVSCAAVVLLCAGSSWLARHGKTPSAADVDNTPASIPLARYHDGSRKTATPPPPDFAALTAAQVDPSAPPDSEQEAVAQYAAEKYELLFEELAHAPPDLFADINTALLRRELATGASGESAAVALASAEAEVLALLGPAQRATFEALKDSDRELFQLNEYAGGVSNVAPLGADERKSILRTKLAYKGRFRQLVADSDLSRDGLSAAERKHAFEVTVSALERYRQDYLQEVRQYLSNDEQFALLRNFETTEFAAELDKLRAKADEVPSTTAPRGG
jgi:hypothetical protein